MSNEDLVNFNFQNDIEKEETNYTATDLQSIYLNDLNQGNYGNGWINFSNLNLIGASPDKHFDWSNAYCLISHGAVVTLKDTGADPAGSSFGSSATNQNVTTYTFSSENAFALGFKGSQHIVDLPQIKFSGAPVNRNSNYNNFMMVENLKKKTTDQYKILGELMNLQFDNEDSYKIDATLGDINNTVNPVIDISTGLNSSTFRNTGHLNRMRQTNYDNTIFDTNISQFNTNAGKVYNSNSVTNNLQQGLIGVFDDAGNAIPANGQSARRINRLVFQYVSIVPLAELHDFYKKLPSVQSSLGFELRLQCNVANNNSWVVNCTGNGNNNLHTINSVVSNQSVGNSCPYILSSPGSGTSKTGLNITAINTRTFSITVNPFIGNFAGNPAQAITNSSTGSYMPNRIYVPQINFTPEYSKLILDDPIKTIKYNDYYIDQIVNQGPVAGTQITRLFNTQLSNVRQLYILPYLSSKQNAPKSYQSLLSSAPNTVSFCRLRDFQIQIGGQNILVEPFQQNNQFYVNNVLQNIAQLNGNSFKSDFISGQITKSMWEKCYNVFTLDMRRVADEVQDASNKSFQLTFKLDTAETYDFLIILTYMNKLTVDRLTGQITSD